MKLDRRAVPGPFLLVSIGCLSVLAAHGLAHAQNPAPTGPLIDVWTDFREGGCKVEIIGSPIVARVLRNTPYAQASKEFRSAELTDLYSADGDWYHAQFPNPEPPKEDRACIAKLQKRENDLRKTMKIPAPVEEVVTRSREAFDAMYQMVTPDFKQASGRVTKKKDGTTEYYLQFGEGSSVQIFCTVPTADVAKKDFSKTTCNSLAAG